MQLPAPLHGFDFDGDTRGDVGVYRSTSGAWFVLRSADLAVKQVPFGAPFLADAPVPADYDGDGKADIAVYRRSNGLWFIRRSADGGVTQVLWGAPPLGDLALPRRF